MVANCLASAPAESTEQQSQPSSSNTKEEKGNPPSHKDLLSPSGESNSSQSQEEPIYYISSSKIQYVKISFFYAQCGSLKLKILNISFIFDDMKKMF